MLNAKFESGLNVTVVPSSLTVPVTPLFNEILLEVNVAEFIVSLNVTVIFEVTNTLVDVLVGLTELTVGGTVSGTVVVNEKVCGEARLLPATSVTFVLVVNV